MSTKIFDLIAPDRHNCRCCSTLLLFALCNEPEAPCPLGSDETSDAAI
jgi:hypothetical protein